MRRLAPAAASAAMIALLLAGCSAGGVGGSSTGVSEPGIQAPQQGGDESGSDGGQAADESAGDPDAADRSVITTGWISITVDDPIDAAEEAAGIADRAGGRIDSRTERPGTDSSTASAQLVLRVPADELDGVVDELRDLGHVDSVQMDASDVTLQRKDLDARVEALATSVKRLEQLLAKAETVADLVAIESELTTRQAELDSLTQQRDALVDQVDYSTLTLDLTTVADAPDPRPNDFWSGVVAGWTALTGFLSSLAVVFGVLLPWFALLVVVAAIVALVVVLATRGRRRSTTTVTAPAPTTAAAAEPDDAASAPATAPTETGPTGPGPRA
ncbi:DUF4349 domain-containing protein [Agromyces endophyticus]|uniref:DUF4349 domain-containing protein n=1 Tax=Agromyces sp. H17E-10 TaxID=2932244 RepID=UPI001FD0B3DC|nr:DUF4349 domain-containing protein [Agromyces sp. H17E-10]UOQ88469.1 DUF4349 domain-containing protein [Agromyces sp. H17E-10]